MKTPATFLVLSLVISLYAADAGPRVFDVRQFGAKGDGKTFDTAAIQKALNECGQAGGGTVKFPPGTYLSQPLAIRNQTTVLLEADATLLASPTQSDYLKGGGDWLKAKGSGDFIPFIGGNDLTNVTFTGKGTIDGNGAVWWGEAEKARQKVSGYVLPRPRLIIFNRCKNLRLTGIKLINSPSSHFVPADCEDVTVENVTIVAPAGAANTDGINPSNSRNVTITHCTIDTGDDNIAVKSGKKVEGRPFGCENITIADCDFLHGHGMAIGSATVGGVHHVVVKNCRFENTDNGLRIKSGRDRGGLVEDISYSNITMKNVHPAISIVSYYQYSTNDKYQKNDPAQPVTETTPVFRNICISNVTATCTQDAGLIIGLPESMISNVVLENIHLTAETGLTIANAKGIQLKNAEVSVKEGPPFTTENAQVEGLVRANEKQ
ncbi:MAG: glycoside hydrolase family 28 protein [Verrucomicrobiota bacterium]|jgi:polygalacturonase